MDVAPLFYCLFSDDLELDIIVAPQKSTINIFTLCLLRGEHIHVPLPQTIKATSSLGDPRVTYNLEEGQVPETNMPVRFYIKPNRADGSASILVAENLDHEATGFFTLRVRVQNVASVPLASFTTVYVNVTGECG